MDIIILSSVVTILFIIFGVFIFREFSKPESMVSGSEISPRSQFIRYVGTIFDQPEYKNSPIKVKELIVKNISQTISDMESDGVYFPAEIKEELEKRRDEIFISPAK
jgi:hypothetical protein